MPDNLIFRVGEGHFDDRAFTAPDGEDDIARSVMTHRALIGDDRLCFSETTVYPANALSPANWIRKMELEISLGLRSLYLMSGTWFFTDPYWDALIDARPRLEELADATPVPPARERDFIWTWNS